MNAVRGPDITRLDQPEQLTAAPTVVAPTAPQGASNLLLLAFGAGFVVVLIAVVALLTRGGESPAPQSVAATSEASPTFTPVSTPTPSCIDAQSQLVLVEDLERRGDWQQAANVANAALNLQGLCDVERYVLTEKAVAAGLKALMDAPHRKTDLAQHQQLVDQYLAFQARARDAGISIMPALQFAEEAHGRSQFLLAKVAIEQALQAGEYQPNVHRDVTRLYISSLYGLCYWYTTDMPGSETFQQGLSYCAASDLLADAFCTGQGEAATKLDELVGTDRQRWPQPAASPLDSFIHEACT